VVLPPRRDGLRLLLALPGAHRAARGGAGGVGEELSHARTYKLQSKSGGPGQCAGPFPWWRVREPSAGRHTGRSARSTFYGQPAAKAFRKQLKWRTLRTGGRGALTAVGVWISGDEAVQETVEIKDVGDGERGRGVAVGVAGARADPHQGFLTAGRSLVDEADHDRGCSAAVDAQRPRPGKRCRQQRVQVRPRRGVPGFGPGRAGLSAPQNPPPRHETDGGRVSFARASCLRAAGAKAWNS
jgi:hypothetical protein